MEDAEDPLRVAAEIPSVLLRLLSLIFDCVLNIDKVGLKLGVSSASCNGKFLIDFVTLVTSALSSRYYPD